MASLLVARGKEGEPPTGARGTSCFELKPTARAGPVRPFMDPDILSGIAGVLGVMIPVLALSIGGLLVLSRSRIGEAVARGRPSLVATSLTRWMAGS